jgi:adenine-specific DNA-methyltransferase
MGGRYPYYLLADSREGQLKEAEITNAQVSSKPVFKNLCMGFVYARVPHITLKAIANNTEIDVIWNKWQETILPIIKKLNIVLEVNWSEWDVPRLASPDWPEAAGRLHETWWRSHVSRQKEIDQSIAEKAEFELLYDKPVIDKSKIRVAGPFTVESVSPHKVLTVDEENRLVSEDIFFPKENFDGQDFTSLILENLKTAGVQQAHKDDKIVFSTISAWPGQMICAEGFYNIANTDDQLRAAIFIGPEFGTVSRPDLVEAAKEAGDSDFDILIACAFNYDARASDFQTLGRIPILKARMNADLHMAGELKNTGKGNLFVVFGEPDIEIIETKDSRIVVKINGVDVFHPSTGEVKSDGADGIACWFIDTEYNEESFFVRHAYFLGANDPYKSLKTTLKAEIDQDAWSSLNSDTSRPFSKPQSGRIAIKVINHLGDEVMKVFKVD